MKGIIRALVAFVVLFIFFNFMGEVGKSGGNGNEHSDTIKSNWHHEVGADPMGEYHYEIAKISNGGVSVQIQRKRGYFSVFVISNSGNISCGDGCSLRVQFDEEKPVKVMAYSIKENVIALLDIGLTDDYNPLWEKIKKSKKINIELNVINHGVISQSGDIVFTFDVGDNPFTGKVNVDINDVARKVADRNYTTNEIAIRGKTLNNLSDINFDVCKDYYAKTIRILEEKGYRIVTEVKDDKKDYFEANVYWGNDGVGVQCDRAAKVGQYYTLNYL